MKYYTDRSLVDLSVCVGLYRQSAMVPAAISRAFPFPAATPIFSNSSNPLLARSIAPESELRNSAVSMLTSNGKESSLDMRIREKYPHRFVESVIRSSFNSHGGSAISCAHQESSHDPSGEYSMG